jgi:hypothetical protein
MNMKLEINPAKEPTKGIKLNNGSMPNLKLKKGKVNCPSKSLA